MFFHPESFFNHKLPTGVPIDPNSVTLVSNLLAQGEKNAYGANFRDWAVTSFAAEKGTTAQAVTIDRNITAGETYWTDLATILAAVPIPASARPPGPWPTGDQHMVIVDEANDKMWEFWRAREKEVDGPAPKTQQAGVSKETLEKKGWHCQAGAGIENLSTNPGYFDSASWKGIAASRHYSAAASGIFELGGIIRVSEAEAGLIPHAITFTAIHNNISSKFRWPAQKTDGEKEKPELAVEEGMIFTVPASLEVEKLFTDKFLKACAVAIRDYGMVINDGSNTTVAISCENKCTVPHSETTTNDAWKGSEDKFGGPGAIFSKFVGGKGGLIEQLFTTLGPHLEVVDASYRSPKT
jgi:hypothetical protein